LLGMRFRVQDEIDESSGLWADVFRLALDPFMGPVAIPAMRTRHMLRQSGVLMWVIAAQMRGDAFAVMEQLDCRRREARLYFLAHQTVRDAVIMFVNFDMIIDIDPAALPLGVLIRLRG
jgi:hypothetical protein